MLMYSVMIHHDELCSQYAAAQELLPRRDGPEGTLTIDLYTLPYSSTSTMGRLVVPNTILDEKAGREIAYVPTTAVRSTGRRRSMTPHDTTSRGSSQPNIFRWPWRSMLHRSAHSPDGSTFVAEGGYKESREVCVGRSIPGVPAEEETVSGRNIKCSLELDKHGVRCPCVVYKSFSSPQPYVEGWEWQKKARQKSCICLSSS